MADTKDGGAAGRPGDAGADIADLAARRVLARVLWSIDTAGASAKPDYTAQRKTYMAKAGQVLRGLKRKGFSLSGPAGVADKGGDQD